METTAGTCRVKIAGATKSAAYGAERSFQVSGKSSFEIAVDTGVAEYVCSFLRPGRNRQSALHP